MEAGQLSHRSRRGFTLVETLLATIILVLVATGVAKFAASFSRATTTSAVRLIATTVARDRLELIRADPRYDRLANLYGAGAAADTTGFPGYPGMRRISHVVRDTSGTAPRRDRTTITVRVLDPTLTDTIALTSVLARP